MFYDRFGEAIGQYEVEFDGEKIPLKLKIGQLHNFYEHSQRLEDAGEKYKLLKSFIENIIIQGSEIENKLSKEEIEKIKFYIELNFQKLSLVVTDKLGITDKEQRERKEELKN